MPGPVNNGTVRTLAPGSARSGDIYQGYASGLYRQAFLTLGDTALAVRVVSDRRVPERAGAGALGLVLIGGLGHVRASRVLGICPRDMAALLRMALLRLAASSTAVAETAEEQEKVMQKLGYVTAITMAAAGAALGVMAVRSLPEVRRYMAIKKM